MSDLARLTVDLARRLGAERIVSLGARAPARLAEVSASMPLVCLDAATELDRLLEMAPGAEAVAWEPGAELPAKLAIDAALIVCDDLLSELDDPTAVLESLRRLLEIAPAALITTGERDLLAGQPGEPPMPWNAEQLLRALANAGVETVWAGINDAHGSLGRRAGLTAAASRNRPGEVRAALAAGALGLGFDPGADREAAGRSARVCIASYEFVGPTRTGGIGTAYTSLAEALADADHEVTVLFTGWDESTAEPFEHWVRHYRARGIRLERLPQQSLDSVETGHRHARRAYDTYLWLRDRDRRERFDVIHFPEVLGHGYYAIAARRLGLAFERTTIAVGTHSSTNWVLEANGTVFQALDDFADDFIERRSVERSDVLISPSAYMLDWLRSHDWRLPERHFVQQYVGSRAATGRPAPSPPEAGSTELVFFGRLEPRKGLRVFCEALDLLAGSDPSADCTVTFLGKRSSIGGLDAGEYVRHRARHWPWPIQVIDGLGQPEAIAHLRAPGRRLTVIPSLADNSPNTVYEALALRIPFVASRVGGTAELIDPRDVANATFDPEADRPQVAAAGTAALASRMRDALTGELRAPRGAVDPEACRQAHVWWHGAVVAAPAGDFEAEPPEIEVCTVGSSPPATGSDVILFIPAGATIAAGGVETVQRAFAISGAELITVAVSAGYGAERRVRVPVGGPVIGGLLRRCFGDAAFAIRRKTFEALGGFADEVELADRAHHLLCRAAIEGVAIEVLPEALIDVPGPKLAPISIVEQSHRRTAIVELYANAPPAIVAGLPLLTQQLYSLGMEREREFADLYANRFGRLTIPIRLSVSRLRRIRARRGRGPS